MCEDFISRQQLNDVKAQNAALAHIYYLLNQRGSSCELQGLTSPVAEVNQWQ